MQPSKKEVLSGIFIAVLIVSVFALIGVPSSPQSSKISRCPRLPKGFIPIRTAEDLLTIGNDLSASYFLCNNLDLKRTPIPSILGDFTGTFDGNHKKIKNMEMVGAGLFQKISGKVVDLKFIRPKLDTPNNCNNGMIGILASENIGHIRGVVVNKPTVFADSCLGVGGLVGKSFKNAIIESSRVVSGEVRGGLGVGGLVGFLLGNAQVVKSRSSAKVIGVTEPVSGRPHRVNSIGGLVGDVGGMVYKDFFPLPAGSPVITGSFASGSVKVAEANDSFNTGGLVGSLYTARIENSSASGAVSGKDYVGGLVGLNVYSSVIASSQAHGHVTGRDYIGGLVGKNWSATIRDSKAFGSITARSLIGGLVGFLYSSTIERSSSHGTMVTGNASIGGLIGYCNTANLSESFSKAAIVSGEGSVIGGLIGQAIACNISNSYSRSEVEGNEYIGGLIGSLAVTYGGWRGSVKHCYSTATIVGGADLSHRRGVSVGYNDLAYLNDGVADSEQFQGVLFDREIAGSIQSSSVTIGLWSSELKSLSTIRSYGFSNSIWRNDSQSQNDGYPLLQWESN